MKHLIDKLYETNSISKKEIIEVIKYSQVTPEYLFARAWETTRNSYGDSVFIRGLVEFSNYCKQNCKYCGIRKDNSNVVRYHLSKDEILSCIKKGMDIGFNSFVLQSGEDFSYSANDIADIVRSIKEITPNSAVALSVGERDYDEYKAMSDAGASRFLLRHETCNVDLYHTLHPKMSFKNRVKCLHSLRRAKFNIGAGFLVGLPNQTIDDLADDLVFLKELNPEMIGIGPFISHPETPLADCESGSLELTYIMLALARLLVPYSLIPATTAVSTLNSDGRIMAFKAGANVVMPNLSPDKVKEKYELYKNKAGINDDALSALNKVKEVILSANLVPDMGRGDPKKKRS